MLINPKTERSTIVKEIVNETRQIYQTVLVPNSDEYSILYNFKEREGTFIPYHFITNIKFNEYENNV